MKHLVLCTMKDADTAKYSARKLLESGLALYIQVIDDVDGICNKNGELVSNKEVLMLIKVASSQMVELEQMIKTINPLSELDSMVFPLEQIHVNAGINMLAVYANQSAVSY